MQCSKVAGGNWVLANLRRFVKIRILKCAYYGLVYSHFILQYFASIWGQVSNKSIKPVEILQNRAITLES